MPSDRSLSLITDERSLSQAWLDACAREAALDEPLDLEAAADFLQAMASAIHHETGPRRDRDRDFDAACRAFVWAGGSLEPAVRQLTCLRIAIQQVLAGAAPRGRDTVDRLLDRAIVAVVQHATVELRRDALVDPLTGLLNRRALLRNLEGELGRSTRTGTGFCLVFVDLDGLKTVNDREGHRAGDAQLVALSRALDRVMRRGDSAYRIGGDEFVVLLPATTIDSVDALVARLRAAHAPPFSWGAATHPGDGDNVEDLLECADARLLERRRRER